MRSLRIDDHLISGDGVTQRPDRHLGRVITPEVLLIHYTASTSGPATVKFFENDSASVHFVVDVDGSIVQMVPCNMRAGHAGKSEWRGRSDVNEFSIGVEIVNPGPLLADGKTLVIDRMTDGKIRYGARPWIGGTIEARHKNPACPYRFWCTYTAAQIATVVELANLLVPHYGLREIVGHDDVAPNRKIDPGPAWPMQWLREQAFTGEALDALYPKTDPAPPLSERA